MRFLKTKICPSKIKNLDLPGSKWYDPITNDATSKIRVGID